MCAASRHNLSKSVGVEEASGSPWEHAEVAKRRSIKGKAPSKRGTGSSAGQKERANKNKKKERMSQFRKRESETSWRRSQRGKH